MPGTHRCRNRSCTAAVEGNVVQPLIMKRAVELKPALLLFCKRFSAAPSASWA